MDDTFELRTEDRAVMETERNRVLKLLQQELPGAEVSEVGSTSVEGAIGKQDIDIVVLVQQAEFDSVRAMLDSLFDRDNNQLSSDCYQGYKASKLWDVAIQLTIKGGAYDNFHAFVAVLRAQPAVLAAYNQLKRDWQGRPMSHYRDAKAAFIEEVLRNCEGNNNI